MNRVFGGVFDGLNWRRFITLYAVMLVATFILLKVGATGYVVIGSWATLGLGMGACFWEVALRDRRRTPQA